MTIYQMEKSPYFYVRLFEDGKVLRKSTKCTERKAAIEFAKRFFIEIKTKQLNREPLTTRSGFEVCALGLMKENKARLARGEVSQKKIDNDDYRLRKDLLPFFRKYEIREINYQLINEYISHLNQNKDERTLSSNSIKVHLSHVKTILKFAQQMGVLQTLPAFPRIKTVDKPRSWLSSTEYSKLHNTARNRVGEKFIIYNSQGKAIRNCTLTQEIYELILFMTNTFIRPTDIRVLKHKHIAVVRDRQVYLRLSHPPTKGHAYPTVSLPAAVDTYNSILKRQLKDGFGNPEDFVFQPEHSNRDYAIQQLHRQFEQLLDLTNLKTNAAGEPRTLYSLRHTAIMFRLTQSRGLDLLSLARAARTSVEMIDRFYAKHLTAEMNVELIQSQRNTTLEEVQEKATKRIRTSRQQAKEKREI